MLSIPNTAEQQGEQPQMNRRKLLQAMSAATALPLLGFATAEAQQADAETVYELRIYHTYEGKLELLLKRFRERETKIFERLDMHGVAFWTPTDEPLKGRTLVYMLRHKSRAAATENWARFSKDSEWTKLKAESEANGAFVEKHESTFLALTDFSPVL